MPSLEGSWTTELSGGLPPLETWSSNPQFAVYPGVDNASYTVELVRHGAGGSQVRAGLWIMKADAPDERKTEFTGMVQKTNVSTNERRSLTLDLPHTRMSSSQHKPLHACRIVCHLRANFFRDVVAE